MDTIGPPPSTPGEASALPMSSRAGRPLAPGWPARDQFARHARALAVLRAAQDAIAAWLAGGAPAPVELSSLAADDHTLLQQVLGEGEVSVQVHAEPALQAQESVFAGVWRVGHLEGGRLVRDTIEVGAIPAAVPGAARCGALATPAPPAGPLPAGLMNAPALLDELRDRQRRRKGADAAHVINLTLLPLSAGDVEHLEAQVGQGIVRMLSRGYGNCRIASTRLPRTWRVTYVDSQDRVILDTLEVAEVPEVACAAREDLEDSAARLAELLDWVGAP